MVWLVAALSSSIKRHLIDAHWSCLWELPVCEIFTRPSSVYEYTVVWSTHHHVFLFLHFYYLFLSSEKPVQLSKHNLLQYMFKDHQASSDKFFSLLFVKKRHGTVSPGMSPEQYLQWLITWQWSWKWIMAHFVRLKVYIYYYYNDYYYLHKLYMTKEPELII